MNRKKVAFALVGMLLMGVLAFWGMAELWSYRATQPIQRDSAGIGATESIRALQVGLQNDLQRAQRALQEGNQTELARALDGARRVARIGHFAADPLFAKPLGAIERARTALQNNHRSGTVKAVQEALAAIAPESPTGRGPLTAKPTPSEPHEYAGAVVVNAYGDRIGRVKTVNGETAVLVLGGKQDVFGFLNVGGREMRVPVQELVFGEARSLGPTMVAFAR